MIDKIIALLIEDEYAYKERAECPGKRIHKQFPAHGLAIEDALPKQFKHRIERVDFDKKFRPLLLDLLKRINNGNAVKQQRAEYIPDIFNIPEIHLQNGKNQPHADYEYKQDCHRNEEKQRVAVYGKPAAPADAGRFKEYPNAQVTEQRNRKCYKV